MNIKNNIHRYDFLFKIFLNFVNNIVSDVEIFILSAVSHTDQVDVVLVFDINLNL